MSSLSNQLKWVTSFACLTCCLVTGARAAEPDPTQTAKEVDRLLVDETIAGTSSTPVPRCDDETFLRRAFLDLIGKPPTQRDVSSFVADTNPQKRQQLVDRLLGQPEYGANWSRYWRDVIMFRRTEDRALIAVQSLTEFFEKQLNENRPWSETATRLITASGEVRENGDAGLIVAQAGMPEDVVSEVSRIFLGVQIQCAQCHDHPTDRWKREQFHHMAAFFPRVGLRLNPMDRTLTVTTIDFAMRRRPMVMNNRFFGTLEHKMPDKDDPSSEGTTMQPVFFLTDQKLDLGVRDADRRGTLAEWITTPQNPWFAKAFVNRIWSELIGEGFYEPVDDMGPDRDHIAPQTLDYLARAFTETGYDVKWFYRTVMATDAYQRQSRSRRKAEETPFVASCAQRLRADQLFSALLTVLNLEGRLPEPRGPMGPMFARRDPQSLFAAVFGYDPSEPRAEVASSIPQALTMMNSPLFHSALSARRPDTLGRILQQNRDNELALRELYVMTLGRTPSQFESDTCLVYICDVGDRNEAFEDIFWSLINTTEFSHRK